jgi:hypothetical protein
MIVENPILEKVRSGACGQTFALPAKKKVSEQMEVASAVMNQRNTFVGSKFKLLSRGRNK